MNDSSVVIDTAMPLKACVKRFNNREDSEIRDDHYLYKDKEKKIRKDTISLKEAMMISSNVGMCYLGWENYRNRRNDLRKQVEKIFPYEILNLDIRTGEYASKINDLTPDRDFLNYCYGYAQSISAMQLITFYNALANGGKMVKPLFCKAVVRNGEEHLVKPITLRESICSKENLKILNELLVNVVENGTGNNIRDNSYGIAGKTGTSICYGAKGYFNASFAGYFPAENPQYTCLVVVKHVPAYGRSAAAPVFKKISDCVVALDPNLENGKIEVGCHTGRKLLSVKHSKQKSALQSGMMPDCDGMTIREALKALEGLSVTFAGHGRVVKQSIPKGSKVKAGSKIHLTLENL